ncbi:hypothetical protein [Thermoanaerobacter wiegelii]|uniref:Nucleotidyltransferase family protein n=1 Tax=Thermoanaerobacter wiegelii Rt8.B1 TaxID=697303 RepID=G2MXM8_9THEO|nr:hypothetical protein [Thermoanaerobacter wiegelii]AEM79258.1 hypothetical protein Thewi_1874 [Thermoanaerobacter wiegelii Rt8.B1]
MSYSVEKLLNLAIELIKEAEQRGVTLRLLGGLAFYFNSPTARKLPAFQRQYKDLDFAVNPKGARYLTEVFKKLGWKDDQYFNALHGATRMLFYFEENQELQADIFIGVFEQCHKLNFEKRLSLSSTTLPISDLLLTKLQIHQLNRKDILDIIMLLYDHDFGRVTPTEKNELAYIVELTSNDWGWYTTISDNLNIIESMISEFVEDTNDLKRIQSNIKWIYNAIQEAPKSIKWKLRNIIGRRIRWYDEPEEIKR